MEKLVNDIYNKCESDLDSDQIDSLIHNLEILSESKSEQEEKELELDEEPSFTLAKENCNF